MWKGPKSRTEAAKSGGNRGVAMGCGRVKSLVIFRTPLKERAGVNCLCNLSDYYIKFLCHFDGIKKPPSLIIV